MALTLRYPVAWYCRKSDNKSDLARQRNLLIGWCLKQEVVVPDHLRFEDTGSRDKSSKRPQFLKMMEMVRRGEIGTVLIQSFERFGIEDSDEFFRHRAVFQEARAVLFSIDESEGNLTDKDMPTLLKVIFKAEASRDEQKKKGERSITGKHNRLLSTKSFQGGPCPYGYDKQNHNQQGQLLWSIFYQSNNGGVQIYPDGGRVEFHGKNQHPVKARYDRVVLVPSSDKSRQDAVKLIFKLWTAQSISINAIARHLNAHKVLHYSSPWTASTVRQILCNPVYTGALVFNRSRAGRFAEVVKGEQRSIPADERGKTKLRPRDQWVVVPGVHEALIDAEVFEEAQKKLGNIGYGNRPPRLAAAWLKGLAFCGNCGRCMVGRKIGKHVYLVCDTRKKLVSQGLAATCDFNSIRHDRLEEILSKHFETIINHGKDRETLDSYARQLGDGLHSFLARTAVQEAIFAEMLQRIADKLGIKQTVIHSYAALQKLVADANVPAQRLKTVQAEVLAFWDAEIDVELSSINGQLDTLATKWIDATGSLADKLRMRVQSLDERKAELEARLSMKLMKAYQASINDFVAFVDRCKRFQTSDTNLEKAEALRAVLSKVILKWVPKKVKGKSRLDGYELEYCGDFADHATACRGPRTGRSVRAGSSGCW